MKNFRSAASIATAVRTAAVRTAAVRTAAVRTAAGLAAAALAAAGLAATGGPVMASPRHATHRVCPHTTAADGAAAYVQQQLGKPYQLGATGPNSFDASGLVVAAYASVGVTLPHGTAALAQQTVTVDRGHLRVGDLVFYGVGSPATVAVYVGNDQVVGVFRPGMDVRFTAIDFTTVFGYGRVPS